MPTIWVGPCTDITSKYLGTTNHDDFTGWSHSDPAFKYVGIVHNADFMNCL